MTISSFTADTSPVIVPPGGTASTTIHWDSGSPDIRVQIFERFNLGAWSRRSLVDPAISGSYSVGFVPGTVYDALMFLADRSVDPNKPDDQNPVMASLTVFALLPSETSLITDGFRVDQQDIGGTFYGLKIATSAPTFATLEVGMSAPVMDADGLLRIDNPLFTLASPSLGGKVADAPVMIHDLFATETPGINKRLDPGTNLFSVVRVNDHFGHWQQIQFAFTTKRRNVKLQWQDLFITNDGVAIGSGSGFFRVEISQAHNQLGDLWWARITKFGTGDTFGFLSQPMITQTGLQEIDDNNREIRVNLWGQSYRSWPIADEFASSDLGPQPIVIPTGRGEQVIDRVDSLFATPDDGSINPFRFMVHIIVNINYEA
jgi:hypothetical protein